MPFGDAVQIFRLCVQTVNIVAGPETPLLKTLVLLCRLR